MITWIKPPWQTVWLVRQTGKDTKERKDAWDEKLWWPKRDWIGGLRDILRTAGKETV